MEAINLAEWLLKKIRQREQDILESLGGGNIQPIEDYRFHIGELQHFALWRRK